MTLYNHHKAFDKGRVFFFYQNELLTTFIEAKSIPFDVQQSTRQ